MYYRHTFFIEWKNYFKSLPSFNKIIIIWFTTFYAIPNKLFVNNNLSKFSIALFIFLIIVISNIFAPFILLYILFWIIILESYFFAVVY